MLKLTDISASYGSIRALEAVSLEVGKGEIVCLLGGNASGKSTTLKIILNLVRNTSGHVEFEGRRIDGLAPHTIVRMGIAIVPENRRIFSRMTVNENLQLGATALSSQRRVADGFDRVFPLFPQLRDRRYALGSHLSGGMRQMLAIGRALMASPRLLLMDEPSAGLAPGLVEASFDLIMQLREQGVTILMVEQNARKALSVADRGYVLQSGRIVISGGSSEILRNPLFEEAYLGKPSSEGEK